MSYFVFEMGNQEIDYTLKSEIHRGVDIHVFGPATHLTVFVKNFLKTRPPFQHDTQRSSSIH